MKDTERNIFCRVTRQDRVSKKSCEQLVSGRLNAEVITQYLVHFLDMRLTELPHSLLNRLPGFHEVPGSLHDIVCKPVNQWEEVDPPSRFRSKDGLKRVVRIDLGQQNNGVLGSKYTGYGRNEVIVASPHEKGLELEFWVGGSRGPQVMKMNFFGERLGEVAEEIVVRMAMADGTMPPDIALRHIQVTSQRRILQQPTEEWRVVKEESPRLMSPEASARWNEAMSRIPSKRAEQKIKEKVGQIPDL
jgi:hypothetical protein